MTFYIVLFRAALDIRLNFRLWGKFARPVGVGLERVTIQVGGDIAGGTGVGVVPPGTAYSGGFFINADIIDAPLTKFDGGADTAKAGAQDEYVKYRRPVSRLLSVRHYVYPLKWSGCFDCAEFKASALKCKMFCSRRCPARANCWQAIAR